METPQKMDDLSWYHGNMCRHLAEVVLLGNGEEGSYLLRNCDSNERSFCLSVRGKYTVKHFLIEEDGGMYTLGASEFESFQHLLSHFANQPILGGIMGQMSANYDAGNMVTLTNPYPRFIQEPETYDEIRMHSTMTVESTAEHLKHRTYALPVASKSGYLTKQGGKVKNWKYRWIVLIGNEFSYYEERHSERPINTISLTECYGCDNSEDTAGNLFCFQLVLPERLWLFSASSEEERDQWVSLIKWKLDYNAKHKRKR